MISTSRQQISLCQETKAGLNSLVKQTAQVGVGFFIMLLLTGGKPSAYAVALSCIAGVGFVAWSEEKRLTQQRVTEEQRKIQQQVKQLRQAKTDNFCELVKSGGLNPAEDFAGANLAGVNGVACNLSGFNLSNTDLNAADLSRADLSNANLRGANLRSAQLNRADLEGANLSNALLIDADLSHADLRGANLNSADLINTDLTGADLCGANLIQANFSSAIVEKAEFGFNTGLSDDAKSDLENRGAIFPEEELVTV
ncbi:pentapeptide repeat-containing protein [Cylindrospermum sp. FACHB-282]|uniref:pentapeptide repeat-containing protein n=1 Tax=Cylindrospermum sp. FACHB-282 TaxID=2692794 RepID=UPI00168552B3|nr:pentapeptide repeat-containing protein [Cylindrospermum sp. FACHB-282]MBD2387250.1 pentapeptide repeat-containing protein [Cylindrospermum sp. FACHB-282]